MAESVDRPDQQYKLPAWESLTVDQQQAIEAGPGWVTQPVELQEFSNVAEFRNSPEQRRADNFVMYFMRDGFVGSLYEEKPAFQRFAVLYPDIVSELDAQTAGRPPSEIANDDQLQIGLLDAYNKMKFLVDKSDPHVVDEAGEVDRLFLTH